MKQYQNYTLLLDTVCITDVFLIFIRDVTYVMWQIYTDIFGLM